MLPSLPKLYGTIRAWQKDCEKIEGKKLEAGLPDVGENGHLRMPEAPSGMLWSALSSAGRYVGLVVEGEARNLAPLKEHLTQMYRATKGLCEQAGISTRGIVAVTDDDLSTLTVQSLKEKMDGMVYSPGGQLVRMHEYLDEMVQTVREGNPESIKREIDDLPELLRESYKLFALHSTDTKLFNQFLQFSTSIQFWLEENRLELNAFNQLEGEVGNAFTVIKKHCNDYLQVIRQEMGIPSDPTPPPPIMNPIKTPENLEHACQLAWQHIVNPRHHGPQLNEEFQHITEALVNLTQNGDGPDTEDLTAKARELYRSLNRFMSTAGAGHPLRETIRPFSAVMNRLNSKLAERRVEQVIEEEEPLRSLHSLPSLNNTSLQMSLRGEQLPERQQYEVHIAPNGDKFIPLEDDKLTYNHLCNEPRFAEKDFEYLRDGSYRIYTRSAYGPAFKHDRIMEKGTQKWKMHLSIKREDMDKAFPIVKDWIMNPENRMYAAKVLDQENRESPDQMGKEFTLYLYEDDEYGNRDTLHWQEKLAELEECLTKAGIRPGPRPAPERHKFDRQIDGSQFLHYRNDFVRVEDDINHTWYREHRDELSGVRYFKNRWAHGDVIVLQQDFNQVPSNMRHNLLPQDSADFLAGVQLGRKPGLVVGEENMSWPQEIPPPKPKEVKKSVPHVPNKSAPLKPLSAGQKATFDTMLANVRKQHPQLTEERLLVMLRDPETGDYKGLDGWFPPTAAVIGYLTLEKEKPGFFPDEDFQAAYNELGVKFYYHDRMPEGAAYQDWINDAVHLVVRGRETRQAMSEWEPELQHLMPESGNFKSYIRSKVPGRRIPEDIPAELLNDYRNHVREELFLQFKAFGLDQVNELTLNNILIDCCENLLRHFEPNYSRENSQYNKFRYQQFNWLDPSKHSYRGKDAMGFFAYADPQADADYVPRSGSGTEYANKFRVSIHPHDYEKAWPLVAEVLHRNNCPFPAWKSTYPWSRSVGKEHERLNMGGQFTLYSLDHPDGNKLTRFQDRNIANTLREIEEVLRKNNIRPGQLPHTDVYFGDQHPYVSYRFDMDKDRKYYEPSHLIGHTRRREYMGEPRYQNVGRLLG
ncbi:hypothetical protein [Endozoicomonas numazuensis]|uniref:Uncharacterized protein n=1 Tax=Endozoicomonas numazuensis TaxID=1137799 RepID=A0A081NFP4_9GAMM|nr:hypothetical protein [Endozoicomonas numazuensis]KEQ17267.1 hypothetical protein GZ78_15700 [Endozoicomonas numazuensis]